jgi:DNA-directed RNA polymerase specialized sigma subunit
MQKIKRQDRVAILDKLNKSRLVYIRKQRESGMTLQAIAATLGISHQRVSAILKAAINE